MKKRKFITRPENVQNVSFCLDNGLRHYIPREKSVVDEFYFEKCSPSDDPQESVSVVDPIIVLFNQQRLDNMGSSAAKAFLDGLMAKDSPLSELRSKCSDDDLLTMLKSRHLQAPSEILCWCRYMQQNVDKFNSEVQKLVEAKQLEESAKLQQTELPES